MSETVEKILCSDGGCNAGEMAALLNNNGNNMWNNPFCYLIFLAMFGRNGMWGGNGESCQNAEILSRLNELGSQANNNQNTNLMMDAINGNHEALHSIANTVGVSFAQLQGAIGQVQNAITQVGGQVGMTGQQVVNSVLLGNKDLTAAIQNCCCNTQQNIIKMGYENQLGQKDIINSFQSRVDQLANGVQSGFAQVGYANQTNTNAIIQAGNSNTQRILDQMCNNTQQELRDKLAEMSQQKQTAQILASINGGSTSSIWN